MSNDSLLQPLFCTLQTLVLRFLLVQVNKRLISEMVSISSWRSDLVTGVLCPKIDGVYPRLPSRTVSYRRSTLKSHDCVHPMFRKVPGRSITHLSLAGHAVKCASFVDRNYQSSVNDDEEPFLINSMKQAIWTAKSILLFLAEQPTQLKYIEWPGFQSTHDSRNKTDFLASGEVNSVLHVFFASGIRLCPSIQDWRNSTSMRPAAFE
ncbi:uncharacterized protein LOC132640723 isoform X2 [Lycium barbarum]|uniref:uncharacterized protein LOC132640723 isoform X2 n=1 Tax=Lycium barbarum TaxID=112863 RepID=UPI00293E42AB|nr:uncharacterized protein LOC132640723 isoform X2 [Lycium barbarum]